MSANVFVSFDHDDQQQVAGLKLIRENTKHPLDFRDHSLKDAVRDRAGRPIVYPPSDSRSKSVSDEISRKFENASKLVVLIGDKTYLSDWVDWEVKTFHSMKQRVSGTNTWKRIRGMSLKGSNGATLPPALGGRSTQVLQWDPKALSTWLDQNPDA